MARNLKKKQTIFTNIQKKTSKKADLRQQKIVPSSNSKEKPKNLFFPRIYRIIAERKFWLGLIGGAAASIIIILGIDIYKNELLAQRLIKKHDILTSQVAYWQDISKKHPDYRDGYAHLAVLEYQLGNMELSFQYAEKALQLDPNYEPMIALKKMISSQR